MSTPLSMVCAALLLGACGHVTWTPRTIARSLDGCLFVTRSQEEPLRQRWCWEPAACRAKAIGVEWWEIVDEYVGLPVQRGPHLCVGTVTCPEEP